MIHSPLHIKFLVLDIDGVCTDGKLYYDGKGRVTKNFYTQDGIGIKTALKLNMGVGVITGRSDFAVETRLKELGVKDYFAGYEAKTEALEAIRNKYALKWEEMAYIGDDWIDLDPMLRVGYPIAVANACKEVKEVALYTTKAQGGSGAVREAIEHLFHLQGKDSKELSRVWVHPF